ncbi:hypothetical protein H9P43_004763 [Blastocladiella emersonii ATCC 22665]|nr:hypothetical protein H9P43_004763 [Blastocladiella emersonii ATCC 22665]
MARSRKVALLVVLATALVLSAALLPSADAFPTTASGAPHGLPSTRRPRPGTDRLAATFGARHSYGPALDHRRYRVTPLAGLSRASAAAVVSPVSLTEAQEIALAYIADVTAVPRDHIAVLSSHTANSTGVSHVYLRQVVNGLAVANADANVNVDRSGMVISFGESFFRGNLPPTTDPDTLLATFRQQDDARHQRGAGLSSYLTSWLTAPARQFRLASTSSAHHDRPVISPEDGLASLMARIGLPMQSADRALLTFTALPAAATTSSLSAQLGTFTAFGAAKADIPVSLAYLATMAGAASLVYEYEVELDDSWYHAHVCAATGTVLSLVDWVADDAYRVYPLGVNDPDDGERVLVSHNNVGGDLGTAASPMGWLSGDTTAGNNVVAQDNPRGPHFASADFDAAMQHQPEAGAARVFDFPIDLTQDPKTYVDAAITQLFYTTNMLHDVFYAYGFTEAAGNFQTDNLGRGGAGHDPVLAYAQDGSGYNNAQFASPPDGKPGKMKMFIWNTAPVYRDGDLENGIVIHEFGHGVTQRLTGGRLNAGCLGWGEAGGMGEGWGDVWSVLFRMRSAAMADRGFAAWEMGKYANGGKVGIRKYPYSADLAVNPSTYATLNANGYWGVHAKGEVWAVMLLEVYWNLVDALGFTPNWTSADTNKGNTLFMRILVDALQLQPCRPNFLDARDAMFQAEALLTKGEHRCAVWHGFAKRGLGVDASRVPAKHAWEDDKRVDGFKVPAECRHAGDDGEAAA